MSFVHLSGPIPNLIKEQLHVGHIGVNIYHLVGGILNWIETGKKVHLSP